MTAFGAIRNALTQFGYPMEVELYEGTEKRFFTYNYADDHGDDFGDDIPGTNLVSVQVHYFMPVIENNRKVSFQTIRKQIRTALFEAGFTYPEVTIRRDRTQDTNNDMWHIIFECEYEEEV